MNAPFDLAAVRKWRDTAVINGYRPIRVRSRGKEPVAPHWQHGEADASLLEVTADAANTGMICRGFRVIDVDIDDPGLVWEITKILNAHLPAGAIVRRRDGSPRYAMVFRAKGEPGKRSVSTARGKVEVLGAGQQLVIDGLHPSGARLTWTG
jgi:hypothetical protein